MNSSKEQVLNALYDVEQNRLQIGDVDGWASPDEVAMALATTHQHYGDSVWVRKRLEDLWASRKVLQINNSSDYEEFQLQNVVLEGCDVYGDDEAKLRVEPNDCRGVQDSEFEQVAIFPPDITTLYRSRMAEIVRLLSRNYQRFKMSPTTGMLRYERYPQKRPERNVDILEVEAKGNSDILSGKFVFELRGIETEHKLSSKIDRNKLAQSFSAVLHVLADLLSPSNANLASFQIESIFTTLCGLYCPSYQSRYKSHVITAGVGSGKSFAFQIGALIHVAYKALCMEKGIRVLMIYPRVVLAGNQFKDLFDLVQLLSDKLGVKINEPCLDAGGQIKQQMGIDRLETGGTFKAIKKAYSGDYPILISNLDTLANRLVHPESCKGLSKNLDLIVIDEIHLLSSLYGAHAKMMIKRLELMRTMWRLREQNADWHFEKLLSNKDNISPMYFVGSSATISEPKLHTARILGRARTSILHIDVEMPNETGWIHHLFLRQRYEASSMSALVNATSCLIHNRSDGLFRDYYEYSNSNGNVEIDLSQLSNPVYPSQCVKPRQPEHIHKTIGFSDSLDNIGRWADLVSDNEKTKTNTMTSNATLRIRSFPYFMRFQEPLWRVVHHSSFGRNPPIWQQIMRDHYGNFCCDCKKGIKCSITRVPTNLSTAQKNNVKALWDFNDNGSYLHRLGVGDEYINSSWFTPLLEAATKENLTNLDECPFFMGRLCWWWSLDHAGNNAPHPPSYNNPLNGFKMPGNNPSQYYHIVNGIRVSSFTSNTDFDVMAIKTVNDVFQRKANSIFRDINFNAEHLENNALIIGSPRLEVGVDLNRVRDGITFQAMRDPASLQQKVGRVGREQASDSMIVHLVTQNTRDQYYFRNPHIALDTEYLQPIPMHEDNRIVARHHFFMAIVDFLNLQGANPQGGSIAEDGERINLINDHKYQPSFSNWSKKVQAAYDFLFNDHPRQKQNKRNLIEYLKCLDARPEDLTCQNEFDMLKPKDAPLNKKIGVIDVFQHEFGPNFFLTPILVGGASTNLAEVCSFHHPAPINNLSTLPRHDFFLKTYHTAAPGMSPNPYRDRSYLWNLLKLSLFRRGIPAKNIPGNQPYVWSPNFFETVGNETVRIFEETDQGQHELGYVNVSMAITLLLPGTVTYRFRASPRKVPVSRISCQDPPSEFAYLTQSVYLRIDQPEYFEAAPNCADLNEEDLPNDFIGNTPVKVYTPRQIGVIPSSSEPFVTFSGMMADDDSRPFQPGSRQITAPPRAYALRWYRIIEKQASARQCRFREVFSKFFKKKTMPDLPIPNVLSIFSNIEYDPELDITEFAWGLDRQFPTRQVEAARLIYQSQNQSVALGHRYQAPGMIFSMHAGDGTIIDSFLNELVKQNQSGAYQSVLIQVLYTFLSEYARNPLPPGSPPWAKQSKPSIFTVRDLKTIVMFRILELWHPMPESEEMPSKPLELTLEIIEGCFTVGHPYFIDEETFRRICRRIARTRGVANPDQHVQTLQAIYDNFKEACLNIHELSVEFLKKSSLEILTNSLGLAMYNAALRLTGAEEDNLLYFYKIKDNTVKIYLFDRDSFGNGTTELVKKYLFISSAERTILERLKVLGNHIDPLPTTDFVRCFEEELQECESTQTAQLAFHNIASDSNYFKPLENARRSEQRIAGRLFEFFKNSMALSSFDHLIPFQACPEFVAYITSEDGYPCYDGVKLIGGQEYPVFQSFESAMGFCTSGCISCLISPEINISGSLNAKETANSILLNAFYQQQVCGSGDELAELCYPGTGPARTTAWKEMALIRASAKGKEINIEPIELHLPVKGSDELQSLSVVPAMSQGICKRVFRTGWDPVEVPKERIRLRMYY